MSKKSPEEIATLKVKYAGKEAEKAAKKAEKKVKFSEANADRNMPTVEMRIPYETAEGRDIDLERPPWAGYTDSLESSWRFSVWLDSGKYPEYPVKRKIIRT